MPYRRRDCRKHFSVRTGTVLAESKLPSAEVADGHLPDDIGAQGHLQ